MLKFEKTEKLKLERSNNSLVQDQHSTGCPNFVLMRRVEELEKASATTKRKKK